MSSNKKVIFVSLCGLLLASCVGVPELSSEAAANNRRDHLEGQKPITNNIKKPDFEFGKQESVSLQTAAQLIVQYHPRVGQALGNENIESEMIAIAKAKYYPQVSGGLDTQRESERSSRYDKRYIQNISLGIEQVLYDFGKISSAVKSAEYGYLGAQNQTRLINEDLIYTSSSAVITADRSKELGILAKEQVQSVGLLSKLVEERYNKGASNLSDVYLAKSRLDAVLSEELDVNAQQESIIRALGLIIGQKQITDATVGSLPSGLESACFIQPAWNAIPEYESAQIEAERALVELESAKADRLPTIYLAGSVSRPLNVTPRYGSTVNTRIGINVSVPVYQGGALSASQRAAEGRIESADARKMEIQLDIEQKLSEAQVVLNNLNQRQSLLAQRVSNLKNTKELYKQQYLELGTRTLIDLLNSEQEYHLARVDIINNRFDIIQKNIECARYQGKLSDLFGIYIK